MSYHKSLISLGVACGYDIHVVISKIGACKSLFSHVTELAQRLQ
jgi:hypothetical protein